MRLYCIADQVPWNDGREPFVSEIQNKAIALVVQNEGDLSPQSSPDRSRLFLKRALKLYFALGGDGATAAALVNEEQAFPRSGVEPAIADVMIEIAANTGALLESR